MTFPLTRSRSRARFFGVPFSPASLFANGEQGVFYDPTDFSTLFQDAAGTTPVTAVEQAVGLMLDKSVPVQGTGYYSGVFDGTGDYLTVPDNAALNSFGDFTIEFWIRFTAVTNSTVVLGKGYSIGFYAPYLFFVISGNLQFFASSNNSSWDISNATNVIASAATNQWYHVVVVRSGSTLSTYANGTRIATLSNSTATTSNSGVLSLMSDQGGTSNVAGYISNLRIVKGAAVYDPTQSTLTVPTTPLTAISGTSLLTCQNNYFKDNSSNAFAITRNGDAAPSTFNPFNSATAQTINNAYQSTGTAQPILRARYNLLTYSEDQSNAVWSSYGATQVANQYTAPDGTLTGDRIVELAGSNLQSRYQTVAGLLSGNHTVSAYFYPDQRTYAQLSFSGVGAANYFAATFELTGDGTVTKSAAGASGTIASASITKEANGWYRCTIVGNTGQSGTHYVYTGPSDSATPTYGNFGVLTYNGNTSNGIGAWGAQLLTAADVTATGNVYQRVAAATVYDTSNAVFRPYIDRNTTSSNTGMASNSFAWGSDEVSVFAGVTRTLNTNGVIVEFSPTTASNNGSFSLVSGSPGTSQVEWTVKGTAASTGDTGDVAPETSVYTGLGDISLDLNTLREDGVVADNSFQDQGTGNFGTYALNIMARNNAASLYFDSRLYSLIVVNRVVNTGELSATEAWVAAKTGVTLPVDYLYLLTAGNDDLTDANGNQLFASAIY